MAGHVTFKELCLIQMYLHDIERYLLHISNMKYIIQYFLCLKTIIHSFDSRFLIYYKSTLKRQKLVKSGKTKETFIKRIPI
jgi:hypothetical protein